MAAQHHIEAEGAAPLREEPLDTALPRDEPLQRRGGEVIRIEVIGASAAKSALPADAGSNSKSERKMSSERIVSTAPPP